MNVIRVRNVHVALPTAMGIMKAVGVRRDSRNGPVYLAPGAVSTVYERPTERVMFWADRDANPYFHFFEKLWMIGGRRDVKSVTRFAKNMSKYSDDGETFHGTYGYRWRVAMPASVVHGAHTPHDQLAVIINRLIQNRDDRRCVLQMWDAESDLNNPSRDVPCNTTATFQIGLDGRLDMVVFCRSNDIIWGCYGANAVHFSGLQEYVASFVGVPEGTYTQISVNWHAYVDIFDNLWDRFGATLEDETESQYHSDQVIELSDQPCPYTTGQVKPYPMVSPGVSRELWDIDLKNLLRYSGRAPTNGRWSDPFFPEVAIPILKSHDCYKQLEGDAKFNRALSELEYCRATDWRLACQEWISRRKWKWMHGNDDGPTPG